MELNILKPIEQSYWEKYLSSLTDHGAERESFVSAGHPGIYLDSASLLISEGQQVVLAGL